MILVIYLLKKPTDVVKQSIGEVNLFWNRATFGAKASHRDDGLPQ